MAIFAESLLIAASFVSGCLAGHRVVTAVKAELAKIYARGDAELAKVHAKLDAMFVNQKNTIHPLGK
jgi:hypothetical protein